MARDLKSESEFGLPVLPDPFGEPIEDDATGIRKITGLTDSDAIKAGAAGDGLSLSTLGSQLREIYATPDENFASGPALPELTPVKKR